MKYIFLFTVLFFSVNLFAQNVGIGTDTPKAKLHTVGSVRHEILQGQGVKQVYADNYGNIIKSCYKNDSVKTINSGCVNALKSYIEIPDSVWVNSSDLYVKLNLNTSSMYSKELYLTAPTGQTLILKSFGVGSGISNVRNFYFTDKSPNYLFFSPYYQSDKTNGAWHSSILGSSYCTPSNMITEFYHLGNAGNINIKGLWTLTVATILATGSGESLLNWEIGYGPINDIINQDIPLWGQNDSTGYTNFSNRNIGIGLKNPTEKLHIAGNIKTDTVKANVFQITPNASLGKVLTSDNNGNGSWQDLPTPSLNYWTESASHLSNTNTGNISIGITSPSSNAYGHGGTNKILQIHNATAIANSQSQLILSSAGYTGGKGGITWVHTGSGGEARAAYIGCEATSYTDNSLIFYTKGAGTLSERFRITENGILQFANTVANRKFVLFDANNNDHQYYGLGINGGTLRYQVDATVGQHAFYSGNNSTSSNWLFTVHGNGNATLAGTLTQLSDARLKTNIQPLQNSLQRIQKLNGYTYNWIDKARDQKTQVGFLAQEIQKEFPELTTEIKQENGEINIGVNYTNMIPVLLEAIKEQQKQIEELKKKVAELEITNK
jgi:hypothetical protein